MSCEGLTFINVSARYRFLNSADTFLIFYLSAVDKNSNNRRCVYSFNYKRLTNQKWNRLMLNKNIDTEVDVKGKIIISGVLLSVLKQVT